MLSPDKRKRLIALLGMIGSSHDGEALNAAKLAQKLIGAEALSWEEVFNGAGDSAPGASAALLQRRYMAGYEDGYRTGLAKGHAQSVAGKFKPVPSDWQDLALSLLREFQLTSWEEGFCQSFVDRGWQTPTDKQRGVFERMCKKFDVDLPD